MSWNQGSNRNVKEHINHFFSHHLPPARYLRNEVETSRNPANKAGVIAPLITKRSSVEGLLIIRNLNPLFHLILHEGIRGDSCQKMV